MFGNNVSKDLPQNKLSDLNLKEFPQKKDEGTLNRRCSRYQAKSFKAKAKCPSI